MFSIYNVIIIILNGVISICHFCRKRGKCESFVTPKKTFVNSVLLELKELLAATYVEVGIDEGKYSNALDFVAMFFSVLKNM
ncbi:hypothetical protein RND81_02G163000 [Saponaria officinalis]|uniref:Uncharacterized protein n=1 Tax=Saponaria officinalis TaxID=3572 RepID=A0AAW1MU08_SAPOF